MRLGQIKVGQVGQPPQAPALAKSDQPADHLMGSSLRNPFLDQEFHQSCGVQKAFIQVLGNPVRAETGTR